ncbi:MAG: S1 family peptidase [Oligoflexia bacterium]|nr:S1 family peptidase [Oligoflexia bacterium]
MKRFLLALLLSMTSAFAMYGDLLPMVLAPKHACHISLHDGLSTCSGTIVSKNKIKTASHCIRDQKIEQVKISCPNGQSFKAKKLILHPEYYNVPNKMLADVAIIEFEGSFNDNIPAYLDTEKDIVDLISTSSFCAVWGYGFHINSLDELGNYHGVALTDIEYDESHIIIPNYRSVMIRSGDSGGGLFCLDGNNDWINVATVYGHDYESSFLLRNDFVKEFLDKNNLKSKAINKNKNTVQIPKLETINLRVKEVYRVRTFSLAYKNKNESIGTGDQKDVEFIVDSFDEEYAYGTMKVNDFSPLRFLCTSDMACYGTYENVKILRSRLC